MEARPAILLVAYNGWELTCECLRRLYPLCEEGFSLVLADNGSSDGTPEKVRQLFPKVELVTQKANLGFGAANNRAASHAMKANPLILLNNDTLPDPGLMRALVKSQQEAEAVCSSPVVMAPAILNPDGSPQGSWGAAIDPLQFFLNAFRSEKGASRHVQGNLSPVKEGRWQEAFWTSAVCWVFPRSLWEELGGFDESIFMYNEDMDLAWRARERGARFFLDTALPLVHLGGASSVSSYARTSQHDSSLYYVLGKHWGLRGRLLSRTFRIARSSLRILLLSLSPRRNRARLCLHARLLRLALSPRGSR